MKHESTGFEQLPIRMDERAWLSTGDAYTMLDAIFPNDGLESVEPQPRSSRLYLVACAHRSWAELPGVCRAVVILAEKVYGTRVTDRALRDAVYPIAESLVNCRGDDLEAIQSIGQELANRGHAAGQDLRPPRITPDQWIAYSHLAFYPFHATVPYFRRIPVALHSPELIREVFGNPYRRTAPMRKQWRTSTVANIAEQIDATGDFSALPVLADALEDAGCDRQEVLEHFRNGGPHVRGCWALRWVLTDPAAARLLPTTE